MNNLEKLKEDFNDLNKLKIFEIEVIDKINNEQEYIIFNIELKGNKLVATHEALTIKESKSKKIAYKCIKLDDCFSLDSNLEDLFNECNEAIMNSDFYELPV